MRKKEYTSPSLTVVNVETECMMEASATSLEVPVDKNGTYNGVFNSKEHSFDIWGSDEDEW